MAEGKGLDGRHRATVEKIFNHPVGHNIQWHDVSSLLQTLDAVTEENGDRYTVTLAAETETFSAPEATISTSNRSSTSAACSRVPG